MTLGEKQRKFVFLISKLIQFAYEQGFELTFGDAFAKTGHMPNSLHYERLAIDLNLFKDGVWLSKTEDHRPLGKYWESLGTPECKTMWGGRFVGKPDGNHYSIQHEGRA